ncbi:MAG TPA: NADP-dependent oxidoreductase, partial [Anaerolineales bacterium]|nr:NADP-dependent oxidoreductase [Anaerolineales bacterium]
WKIGGGAFKQFSPLQFPWTPGIEAAGVVEAVGLEVKSFRRGQEVYGALSGAYAEYAIVKETDIQPKPAGITFEEAASVPVGALTAWGAVINTANVRAEQQVLVHGGAGGVGNYAVQLAHWKRAHVAVTVSEANKDFARSIGAETVIDYNATPFETVLRDLDVVVDTVGGELAARSFKVLKPGGLYVTVAGRLAEGAGQAEGIRATGAGRAPAETLRQISKLITTKQIRPVVGRLFSLAEAPQAQAISQRGHGRGRIILVLSP